MTLAAAYYNRIRVNRASLEALPSPYGARAWFDLVDSIDPQASFDVAEDDVIKIIFSDGSVAELRDKSTIN